MVLESILDPKKAEDRPIYVFIVSILFTLIGVWLAYNIFPSQASILSIAFVTIFFVPFFQHVFDVEEELDEEVVRKKEKEKLRFVDRFMRHRKIIWVYSAFFIGVILTYSFLFTFNPQMREVYTLQLDWFRSQSMAAIQEGSFLHYFSNNTQVMTLFFVLSIIFGAGAVFILAWNASIIAIFIGLITNKFVGTAGVATAYIYGVSTGLGSIALHGIPEVMGYFFAGIAGGILSVGLIREEFMSAEFKEVAKDSLLWLVLGEILIVFGAWLEAVF